jgi:methylated-DNA-protein-cysteine methyltransferase-like protein
MTSVKVPPRSIQNCQPVLIYFQSVESSWRRNCVACIILAPSAALQRIAAEKLMLATGTSHQALQAIWKAVRTIPRGQVSSYGAVAKRAGLPGRSRLVGHALKVAPPDIDLPWHRVVGAGGRIAFPKTSRQFAEQRKRLRAEGVVLARGRVVSEAAISLDELLWKRP